MKHQAIILHGGCGSADLSEQRESAHQTEQAQGLTETINQAWSMLRKGASAVDVAVAAVTLLEDCPAFNAGIGAAVGEAGHVSLDASVMDGGSLGFGGVAALRGIQNAAQVADALRKTSQFSFRVGEGAQKFAINQGIPVIPEEALLTPYQLHWYEVQKQTQAAAGAQGTVGAVVRDATGSIASCTSTGGATGKPFGRVGDSAIIGAGCYADNRFGGASATGYGEQILKVSLCKLAIDLVRFERLEAQTAAQLAIDELGSLPSGYGGIIMIDSEGRIGCAANEQFLPRAWMTDSMPAPAVEFAL